MILPVHFAGMPCEMNELKKIAKMNNLKIVEDAAHAAGSEYKKKKIGSFGHSTIFSFHMAKVVSGVEGGCIVTNDRNIAKKAKLIRTHGDSSQYSHKTFGLNFRISDIHSAIIFEQLKKINRFLQHREKLAKKYKDELNQFEFQEIPDFVSKHPYMLFGLLAPQKLRNSLNNFLQKYGI